MVFQADAAFALILIALGVGCWVLVKAKGQEAGNLKGFGTILSATSLSFARSLYCSVLATTACATGKPGVNT